MKVVALKMCFCLLARAKSLFLDDTEFEDILKSLCEAVNTGITNVILSKSYHEKCYEALGLGLGMYVRDELEVSSDFMHITYVHARFQMCSTLFDTYLLQVWNCMLSKDVFVAANECQDAWTGVCCQRVKQRVDRVSKFTTHHTLNTQPMQ